MVVESAQLEISSALVDSPLTTLARGLTVRVYRELRELDTLRPAWDRLLDLYPPATTFSSWEWLTCWWRSFGKHDALFVLAAFDSQNQMVGLAPLAISRQAFAAFPSVRVLRFMGDGTFDSDNLDMLVRTGSEASFVQALFNYLEAHRSEWDVCELNTLPPDSSVSQFLTDGCAARKWTSFEHFIESAAIYLSGTWEEYLNTLSTEDRKNIGRYTRRLNNRYDVRISRCTRAEEIFPGLDALFRLHQRRWEQIGHRGSFSSLERREFYRDLSLCLLNRGWLELWLLELDGAIAAVQFAFRFRDHIFQLQEGYDSERCSDRPGLVLRAHVLKQFISEGVRVYDFLAGDGGYKKRWGAQSRRYQTVRFAMPFTRGSGVLRLMEGAADGKQWLRRRMPAAAWKLLKNIKSIVAGRKETSAAKVRVISNSRG